MPGKILYIVNHIDWFWSHRLPLAQAARDKGFEVTVACTGVESGRNLEQHGFRGVELPDAGPFSIIRELQRVIRAEKPDIMHVITIKYAFLAGIASFGLNIRRIIHTIAGLGYLYSGDGLKPRLLRFAASPMMRLALKRKNIHLIFQNPDDRNLLIKRSLADPARSHLIRGSGVDTSEFPSVPEPEEEIPFILMPTRLVHEKGISVFIEAARLLKKDKAGARFIIAGGVTKHNPRAITEEEIMQMTGDGAAEWLGKVDDMPGLLAESTMVVYPSYYGEGIPKVLLEAASSGRAIITTNHPGCREVVNHGENGLLVPVKDAAATAEAIRYLLDNPEERRRMGREGRSRAETEFSTGRVIAETLELYSAL